MDDENPPTTQHRNFREQIKLFCHPFLSALNESKIIVTTHKHTPSHTHPMREKVNENRAHSDLSSNFAWRSKKGKLTKAKKISSAAAKASFRQSSFNVFNPPQQQCGILLCAEKKGKFSRHRARERERKFAYVYVMEIHLTCVFWAVGDEVAALGGWFFTQILILFQSKNIFFYDNFSSHFHSWMFVCHAHVCAKRRIMMKIFLCWLVINVIFFIPSHIRLHSRCV